ncbi:VIN3-like protein 1 [Iris pallida]|uniref:VIN3-like protein 1 n=1 Tax=Iris pallida TaxID=29817 RepID=A0AAX6FUW8_IRIPA|nr:VIN3-like protein 1 [Iris pallida]
MDGGIKKVMMFYCYAMVVFLKDIGIPVQFNPCIKLSFLFLALFSFTFSCC